MELTITQAEQLKKRPEDSPNMGFGTIFTDHMFNMDYSREKGWHHPRIEPFGPMEISPATMVLHYGQAIFEGLKAYRTPSDDIQLFRPMDNLNRLNISAERMCIPRFDADFILDAIRRLMEMEKEWVPRSEGTSLYIRPTIIATDPYIGLRSSFTYRFFIILSPVGAYYPEGFNPVSIWVTEDYVRAVRGGVGSAKTAGNYAASLYASEMAHQDGYTQVLWLDGVELKNVEEVGSMNIFFVMDDEIVTPRLNGSILPGITRDSAIALSRLWGRKVTERKISIDEVFQAHDAGRLQEVFGSGTAAVISPVGQIKFRDREIVISEGKVGPVAARLFKELTDIQYGRAEDPMNWIVKI
jgi:branched-chain amino acid aminotransferase